ncbi:hypothetical protein AVEN_44835-1 [Araneus ventricosus]|uniref:Uncharacterized protein n=1 Tax=Araneus ventricosus TaxID=182803 RepID=A0A4Y2CLU0_ARAVE|nr:hypothetical protein AVEN_44835-1 [Araneus ventricosus]
MHNADVAVLRNMSARVSLNDPSGFKTLCIERYTTYKRRVIHDKIHTFPKFKSPPRCSRAHYMAADFLNRELPHCCIGRAGLDDVPLLPWTPRSPDLTPCDFFLWGLCEGQSLCTPNTNNAASTAGTQASLLL